MNNSAENTTQPEAQGQQCPAPAPSPQPVNGEHSASSCANATYPTIAPFCREQTLDQWITEQAEFSRQQRKQEAMTQLALENLAAQLQAHLKAMNKEGNK